MRRLIPIVIVSVVASLLYAIPQAEAAVSGSCSSGVSADFNGDGKADLAIGAPLGDVNSTTNAGLVSVIYGGSGGLDPQNTPAPQLWGQGTAGAGGAGDLAGTPQASDKFGACLAAGDFNGDGKADLAVGVPGDNVGSAKHAGAVNVIYGTASGLASSHNQLWNQASSGMIDTVRAGSGFGAALAAGDFDGDGRDDLAIGVPNETVAGFAHAGVVDVLYGSASRLTSTGNQKWRQGATPSGTLTGHAEEGDRFGAALAAGDFGGTGRDALAIGVPGEGIYGHDTDEGVVTVLYSNAAHGLTATGSQTWWQGKNGILNTAEDGDLFGASLATGDFNNDGADDLAIGVPREDTKTVADAGAVNVIYGDITKQHLVTANNQFFTQNSPDVLDQADVGDHFGAALTVGDFNGDGSGDLAIGVPLEDAHATDDGAVNIIYGSATGLNADTTPNQFWTQGGGANQAGDTGEDHDAFGAALASGDYNNDGKRDLVIGIPNEDHGFVSQGAISVLVGSSSGITSTGRAVYDINSDAAIPGSPHQGDQWGAALG